MSNKISLDEISRHLVILHGPSGGGKSIMQDAIEGGLGYQYAVRTLASGDCFRALQELNPQMAKEMRAGKFIGTLDATMPKLVETIGQFLSDISWMGDPTREPILILDGFLRIGKYQRDGKTIPSQIDQVAAAFLRVVEKRMESDKSLFDSELVSLVEEQGGIGSDGSRSLLSFFSDVVRDANHYYLDVRPKDAESLMRVRSEGNLGSVLKKLDGRSGKLGQLRKLLNEARLIQKGSFAAKTKGSRIVVLKEHAEKEYHLKPIPERYRANLDMKMNQIIRDVQNLVIWGEGEDPSFAGAIKKLLKQKGVETNDVTIPRDDDLTHKSRSRRINEFKDLTIEGILKGELGFRKSGEILVPTGERQGTIINGPSRGIGLEELGNSCVIGAVGKLSKDMAAKHKEGSVFGRERYS